MSYVLMKMIMLQMKIKMQQTEQSYQNLITRKHIMEQILNLVIVYLLSLG